ncbi:hypothetical protein EHS13_26670 [Paenibacillus psychroresistens]|uniref:Uncharacterized protein n=1 Tax=Paenibacillus psychroresistens TaxID=1778678 RepID=A0A6B8RRP6_9BACL|nr:hypothetical protein [Paenibacillus psychroresistens]QGQ98215.1 hypothetical protein EHS13_26670 [Paenibacillus psychroresistens]
MVFQRIEHLPALRSLCPAAIRCISAHGDLVYWSNLLLDGFSAYRIASGSAIAKFGCDTLDFSAWWYSLLE